MLAERSHSFESDNVPRSTSGDAIVPNMAFSGCIEIVLTIASTLHYLEDGVRVRVVRATSPLPPERTLALEPRFGLLGIGAAGFGIGAEGDGIGAGGEDAAGKWNSAPSRNTMRMSKTRRASSANSLTGNVMVNAGWFCSLSTVNPKRVPCGPTRPIRTSTEASLRCWYPTKGAPSLLW